VTISKIKIALQHDFDHFCKNENNLLTCNNFLKADQLLMLKLLSGFLATEDTKSTKSPDFQL